MFSSTHKLKRIIFCLIKKQSGFTVIELLVVISIATAIITSLVIQQNGWNDTLAVKTQAYEAALMIRQAQIYSLGVRENVTGSGDKFDIGYGVYVDRTNPGQYIFFADTNKNLRFDNGEAIETKILNRGVVISNICPNAGCSASGQVHISFFRPEPKANIVFVGVGSGSVPPVTLKFTSPRGKVSSVTVESNGKVSVTQ